MSKIKVGIPQGTRDFSAGTIQKREFILGIIRRVFASYGFQPLETPAMENLETLMGKYGEEGDRLIFKILNNGLNDPKHHTQARKAFEQVLEGKNNPELTARALRYDLTIPFARYVAMNHAQLQFPFKRYQIQPVWRADRPQKGRYREFLQCDADVVGSRSLLNEVELISIYEDVFSMLKLEVEIKINHRQILTALAAACGAPDRLTAITTAIDKLDKAGLDQVKRELTLQGLDTGQLEKIEAYLAIRGSNEERLASLDDLLGKYPEAKKGVEEIRQLLGYFGQGTHNLTVDFALARGLNYYTGTILEVRAKETHMGSIGGGGRYDDLTGLFGVPGLPGVGISFGLDRIYDVMETLQRFPAELHVTTQVLFFHMGESESRVAFQLMQLLRKKGHACELYHESAKFEKQFKYAEKKMIPFAVILGSRELANKTCVVRDLRTGEQMEILQSGLQDYAFE
jgi:histidyl-tRNA synthetase